MTESDNKAMVPAGPAVDAPQCTNCGRELLGSFCVECGQRDRHLHHSIVHFVGELFSEVFESDARLWRTLGALLGRPGYLSVDYLAGRRARYLPPLRLYLAASLVFFLFNNFLSGPIHVTLGDDDVLEDVQVGIVAPESGDPPAESVPLPEVKVHEDGRPDFNLSLGDEDAEHAEWLGLLERRLEGNVADIANDPQAFLEALYERTPTALFLSLPIFALLSRLLWLRSGRWYVEHLVFSLHLFALVFFILTVELLLGQLTRLDSLLSVLAVTLDRALSLYLLWYCLQGFRSFLGGSWLGVSLRVGLLATSYLVFLLMVFLLLTLMILLQ